MVATNDDLLIELKKIRKLLKAQYNDEQVANDALNKEWKYGLLHNCKYLRNIFRYFSCRLCGVVVLYGKMRISKEEKKKR